MSDTRSTPDSSLGDLPACFEHIRGWLAPGEADRLLARFQNGIAWEQQTGPFGHPLPRLTAWFGSGVYTYSGTANRPQRWLAELDDLRGRLEVATKARYNRLLGQLLPRRHRQRRLALRRRSPPRAQPDNSLRVAWSHPGFNIKRVDGTGFQKIRLEHGDLLMMRHESQSEWRHSLPKGRAVLGRRINFTFRWFASVP